NCIYCQLGEIQKHTMAREIYVPTNKIKEDINNYKKHHNEKLDVLMLSGCGEPTLALNIEEIVQTLKASFNDLPIMILTNGTTLHAPEVQNALKEIDRCIIKLDATTPFKWMQINRPVETLDFESLKNGILDFKNNYRGKIDLQVMLLPGLLPYIKEMTDFTNQLTPENIQLNTPKRPYPLSWHRENRGNHQLIFDYEVRELRPIVKEDAKVFEDYLKENTSSNIISVYH
ncbi:MAG: radical SAM protein, partial [bacterium]